VTDVVMTSRAGDVETWTLNRPGSRNALDPTLLAALTRQLSRAEDDGVRVVILTGAGRGFCAGADLGYLLECAQAGQSPRRHLRNICDLTLAMEASPIVFIAALHGFAVAGGLEIALACDLVIAAEGTRIGDGHVKNNLIAGGGASVRMPPKLGRSLAAWLALTGELVRAEDLARRTGWLHDVVAPDALLDTARTMATVLTSRPADAQHRYRRLLVNDPAATAAALTRELDMFEEHWNSSDVATHLTRFLDRSAPRSSSKKERTVA
jgi:enoyl-CoA hydratase